MKYIPLFILIQLVSALLFVIGIPLCAILAYSGMWSCWRGPDEEYIYHYPRWAWLWDNDQDGTLPYWYALAHPPRGLSTDMFFWTALRNPVNNLRNVPGVSAMGRPLWRREFGKANKYGSPGWYVQAGWNSSGYPVLSGGINVNDF